MGEVREKVEGQQFTRGVENTNTNDCISSLYTSVADPGCLSRIPDPDFYPSRIPDPKTIRKLSSITRFDNESQKKVASLPILVLDSRSRFTDLSFHSQLCI